MLRFSIFCKTHECPVIDAMFDNAVEGASFDKHGNPLPKGTFEIDSTSLYCTKNPTEAEHDFVYTIHHSDAIVMLAE